MRNAARISRACISYAHTCSLTLAVPSLSSLFPSLHKLREREAVRAAVEAAVSDPLDASMAQVMAAMCLLLCQCFRVLVREPAAPRWESTARG